MYYIEIFPKLDQQIKKCANKQLSINVNNTQNNKKFKIYRKKGSSRILMQYFYVMLVKKTIKSGTKLRILKILWRYKCKCKIF